MPRAGSPLRLDGRAIALLAAALALAVFLGAAASSLARQWTEREAMIAQRADQLWRLRSLMANQQSLESALRDRETQLEAAPRLITARTSSLAAAELQTLVQRFADESLVTVSQLDVAGEPDSLTSVEAVPATLSAIGDIAGVTDLLSRLQRGPRLVEVRELTLTQNPVLRGDLFQLTATLRAPFVRAP